MLPFQYFIKNKLLYSLTDFPSNNAERFVIIRLQRETNSKTFWDSYITLSNQFHQALKYQFRFEKVDKHFLIYFENPEEFDTILTPRHEPKKEREFLESRVGPLSMQYFEKRNQIIGKVAEVYTIKR